VPSEPVDRRLAVQLEVVIEGVRVVLFVDVDTEVVDEDDAVLVAD
jgi:hypothetical protein